MKIDCDFDQHFQSGHKSLSGFPFKIRPQSGKYIRPYNTPGFGQQGIARRVFLHELQVTMAGIIYAYIAQFRLHPIFIRQAGGDTPPDQ